MESNPWSRVSQDMNNVNSAYSAQATQIPLLQNSISMQYQSLLQTPSAGPQQQPQYPTFPNNSGIGSGVPFGDKNPQQQNLTSQPYGSPYELEGQARAR